MEKIDPYKHKERWINWKEKVKSGIPDLSPANSEIIMQYLTDMEYGMNVAAGSVKGSRSYSRLVTLKERLCFLARNFQELYNNPEMTQIKEGEVCRFFADMRKGVIKRYDGAEYKSVADYVKVFKSFWHWWIKINRKLEKTIPDITLDLDITREKPRWVYLTEEQIRLFIEKAKYEYKVLIMFLFDTGIRAPTELINVKVSDLYNNCKELNIRDEVSKTFGRRIKLMMCSKLLKEYIENKKLKPEDQLFPIIPSSVNKYLKRNAKILFGDEKSLAGQKYSELTMYDFRHCSCCYWLPRYKSESALKFRFGWKKSDKIHYYSEMLGMRDTISEEDLLIDITKTELERRLTKTERENEILRDEVQDLKRMLVDIAKRIDKPLQQVKTLETR
jgi:hypothetical protein